MKERTLRILEFNKIKNKLRNYAVTSGGKELIDNLTPYGSVFEVEKKLEETNEALGILIRKGTPPFEGLYETKEELERAGKGGVLNPGQLIKIGNMLRCSRKFKDYVARKDDEIGYKNLEDLAYILVPLKNLESEIDNAIISEEEIRKMEETMEKIMRNFKAAEEEYLWEWPWTEK